jgi:hypothetical protein
MIYDVVVYAARHFHIRLLLFLYSCLRRSSLSVTAGR